jgi:Ca2+-binding EF-hand superfamily protein
MKTLQAKTLKEKIDLFFDVIDEDGNGKLSYEEIFRICKLVLKQAGAENEKFLNEFSHLFTKIIFEVAKVSINEEIPMISLKDVK